MNRPDPTNPDPTRRHPTNPVLTTPVAADGPLVHAAARAPEWWRTAVIYQVYPRSWADSDGDGIGDLPGITARLPHLVDLGVDALWLSPFYARPQNDAGYDVADYRDVDPLFGTLADADALIARAHELGLRVIVDLVPNHTSSEHPWFRAALAAAPGSPERARYLFREGRAPAGRSAPNNWRSVFGGQAWTRVPDPATGEPGQWYLHLFDATQPDLDWTNPEVRAEFESILRFWLDRGVDGFRVDVAHGLVKAPGLPNWSADQDLLKPGGDGDHGRNRAPMWDQDEVHEIYRAWRRDASTSTATRVRTRVATTMTRRDASDHDARARSGHRPDPRRRGVGRPAGARRALRPPRRDAPGLQLRLPAGRRGPRPRSAPSSPSRFAPTTRSGRRPPGCCPTTT